MINSTPQTSQHVNGVLHKQPISDTTLTESEKEQYKARSRQWQDDNIFQYRLKSAQLRSRSNNTAFNITVDDVIRVWEQQNGVCYYSGMFMTLNRSERMNSMSIDRRDTALGYIPDNIVLCCSVVNRMKQHLSVDEFVELCDKVVNTIHD